MTWSAGLTSPQTATGSRVQSLSARAWSAGEHPGRLWGRVARIVRPATVIEGCSAATVANSCSFGAGWPSPGVAEWLSHQMAPAMAVPATTASAA